MNRKEAIDSIFAAINPSDVVVSTTGLISREIFERFDSERNIYVPGSMGLVSSIGLGIAISSPNKKVIVIDGDASLLMNLGSLVTAGKWKPSNFLHIVLDNSAYGSCSEESSMSSSANLNKVAADVGYQWVQVVDSKGQLESAILIAKGSGFILTKITLGGRRDFLRPLQLTEIKNRFMRFMSREQGRSV